jgi:signal transduction histidine kinase
VQICVNGDSNVTVELAAAQPMVRGDAARLQQVFWNLLSNAQKFTPKEGSISIRSTNPQPGRIRIDVIDSGIGIDPALMPKLFHAFEQGNGVAARKFGGLGLGLAISKSLIAAHGGTLSASSDGAGKGATFTVELPCA